MKKLLKYVCVFSLAAVLCFGMTACSGNRLTGLKANEVAEIVFYNSTNSVIIKVSDTAEISSYIADFRTVEMTKHKDKYENWKWTHTVSPIADLFFTVDLVFKEEKTVTVGGQSSTKETFKIYRDYTVFKSGTNCIYTGDMSQETVSKIFALFALESIM